VDPAGGSTASTAVTASAATASIRGGGRAPDRQQPGPEFRPAPATGQNVGQKCVTNPRQPRLSKRGAENGTA
jgi:hypothetical protein